MHFNNANKNIIATKFKIESRSDILKAQNNKWFHIKEDSRILLNQKMFCLQTRIQNENRYEIRYAVFLLSFSIDYIFLSKYKFTIASHNGVNNIKS